MSVGVKCRDYLYTQNICESEWQNVHSQIIMD